MEMAKSLTLKILQKDKGQIEVMMQTLQQEINKQQIQLYRLDGILGYLIDNIGKIREEKDDR